ncbi:MAG: divergent polysaccharide deacetylase family protein [Armatimonadetes bacterium]|nr:divergent polysaccharide deacetylase family protein [Armatimonadota bacterium]
MNIQQESLHGSGDLARLPESELSKSRRKFTIRNQFQGNGVLSWRNDRDERGRIRLGRRPSKKAGRSRGRAAAILLTVLAVAAFATGFLRAVRHPLDLLAGPEKRPTRLKGAAPAPQVSPVQTEQQPAAQKRKQRQSTLGLSTPSPSPSPRGTACKVAIIIDDCGNNWRHVEGFVRAPAPVTLAILPHLAYSVYIAEQGRLANKGIMLHFPMEAMGSVNPGPGTLRLGMTDEEMSALVQRNLASIPHLDGVNNHEGSRATADPRAMSIVMSAIKQRGLFFVDSMTSADSCAAVVASRMAIRCARRDVFLDNEDDVDAIKDQMRLLIREAQEKGEAIGIGHARPDTLTAFVEMLPAFEEAGITLVLVRDLAPLHSERTPGKLVGAQFGKEAP